MPWFGWLTPLCPNWRRLPQSGESGLIKPRGTGLKPHWSGYHQHSATGDRIYGRFIQGHFTWIHCSLTFFSNLVIGLVTKVDFPYSFNAWARVKSILVNLKSAKSYLWMPAGGQVGGPSGTATVFISCWEHSASHWLSKAGCWRRFDSCRVVTTSSINYLGM